MPIEIDQEILNQTYQQNHGDLMMRKYFVILSMLVMSSAFACPNLTGTFQCYNDEDGYYTQVISQSGSGLNTRYNLQSDDGSVETIVANDQWIHVDEDGQKISLKAKCEGEKLNLIAKFDSEDGEIQTIADFSIDQNTDLYQSMKIVIESRSMIYEFEEVCTRL